MLDTLPTGHFYGRRCFHATLANDLQLVVNRYAVGSRVPIHSHESPFVALILAGSFHETLGTRDEEVKSPSVLFHPAGEPHCEQHGDREVRILTVQFTPQFLRRAEHRALVPVSPIRISSTELASVGRRVYLEALHDDVLAEMAVEAYVLEFLVTLQRLTRETSAVPRWLRRVRDRLNDCIAEPPSLWRMATDEGVHPGHLSRAFRSHFRCTITEYVRRNRIARAEDYLATTQLTLAEIAAQVGYSDQSHFSSAFKREKGTSPGAYRRSFL